MKLYNVVIYNQLDRITGSIQAENFREATVYLAEKYPNYTIESLDENFRQLL